jgi:CRP/FNR family transcriptional regulator, cyclic AMP receptor protein
MGNVGVAMASSDRIPPFPDSGHSPSRRRLKRQELADHLAVLPLFSGCSKRELRHLAGMTRHHQLEAGQHVFEEGQSANAAYVIVAGHVEVRRNGQTIAELGPGQVVGELGVLLRRDHSATVTAKTPVDVVALPRVALKEAVQDVPGLAWHLLEAVAERLSSDDLPSN